MEDEINEPTTRDFVPVMMSKGRLVFQQGHFKCQ